MHLHIALAGSIERNDLSYPPVIGSLSPLGHAADFLAPGDRIHQIDGISTIGLSNQHVMSMLCGACDGTGNGSAGVDGSGEARGAPAVVEIEYSLPEYSEYEPDFKLNIMIILYFITYN